jgi:hypothetical protein
MMYQALPYVGLWLAIVGFAFWSIAQIRYRITRSHLKVTLFGICLRRIDLLDIRYISKHPTGWCERWSNTLSPRKRTLVIHRRSGLFRQLVITPSHRYVFKNALKEMVARRRMEAAQPVKLEEFETGFEASEQ